MKMLKSDPKFNNERGSVLIVALLVLMALTLIGISAMNTTSVEILTAANDRRFKDDFNNAERAIQFATANFQLIYQNDDGLPRQVTDVATSHLIYTNGYSPNFLNNDFTGDPGNPAALAAMGPAANGVRFFYVASEGVDPITNLATQQRRLAFVEIRAVIDLTINNNDQLPDIPNLSDFANAVPSAPHLGPAPSGFDPATYVSRRYAISATAINEAGQLTNTRLQVGVLVAEQQTRVANLVGLY